MSVTTPGRLPTALEKHCRSLPHFRMTRGMTLLTHDGLRLRRPISGGKDWDDDPYMFPDLTDPATIGCLLALVRDAWGDPLLAVHCQVPGEWDLVRPGDFHPENVCYVDGPMIDGETEAEALVAALEAAP